MFFKRLYLIIICLFLSGKLLGTPQHENVVILGSGPAGLTAAIYTSRAGLRPLLIEGEEPGGQIGLSIMVDNFPGFPNGINGYDLIQNMREQATHFGARLVQRNLIEANLKKRPFMLKFDDGSIIHTKTLIIATGASAKWLGLETEKHFIGNGVGSCAICDGVLFKGKEVVVVGGGDTAIEDALYLANHASKVTVVHRRDTLKASKHLSVKAFGNDKIHFIWNATVEEIKDLHKGEVSSVILKDVHTGTMYEYPCQGVFIAIGHAPNTNLFEGQLELTKEGYIRVEPLSTKTSVPGVFAAGDVADPHYRQAITAAGTGCMAGIDAYHFIQLHE